MAKNGSSSWLVLSALLILTLAAAVWSASTSSRSSPPPRRVAFTPTTTTTTPLDLTPAGWLPPHCAPLTQDPSAPAGARFTVSATHLAVGQTVTLTGDDCPPGTLVTTSLGPENYVGDVHQAGPDGTWSVTTTIQPGVYGPGTVSASCVNVFFYPNTFAVTFSTPYRLIVLPSTTVAPGTALTIEPVGSFCSSIDSVIVGVSPVPIPNLIDPDASASWPVPLQYSGTDNVGSSQVVYPDLWQTKVTLPTSVAPGTYYVVAGCAYSRSVPGIYQPTAITIT